MINVVIGGTTVSALETSLDIQQTVNKRATCTFTVADSTGLYHFQYGEQCTVTDASTSTVLFAGIVQTSEETLLIPTNYILSKVTCIDNTYFAGKRAFVTDDYNNVLCGAIVCDLISKYLTAEGVTADYAARHDESETQFNAGTLSGTVGTSNNPPNGDLELSPAGSIVTETYNSNATFNSGTYNGTMSLTNTLEMYSTPALMYQSTAYSGYGPNLFVYTEVWNGEVSGSSYVVASGDELLYTVWINKSSPQIKSGIDLVCTDGTTLRDSGTVDQNNISCHPGTDLSGFADNQWYARTISLSALVGKTISFGQIGFEGDNAGQYTAYFQSILIKNGSTTKATIFNPVAGTGNPGSVPMMQVVSEYGYSFPSLTAVNSYPLTATWMSPIVNAVAAGILGQSEVSWAIASSGNSTLVTNPPPTIGTSYTIAVSFDNGATFQPVSNNFSPIPLLMPGISLTNVNIQLLVTMKTTGGDPTGTPQFTSLAWTVQPSYTMVKTKDIVKSYISPSDWSAGTETEMAYQTAFENKPTGLSLINSQRNWDDETLANQTLFTDGGGTYFIDHNQIKLQSTSSGSSAVQTQSRFDFAGTWADFVVEMDIAVNYNNCDAGITYRTTNWNNTNNTYAYYAFIQQQATTTNIVLGRGSNGGSGSFTSLQSVTLHEQITNASLHTLKVIAIGNSHQVFLDGNPYISVTDGTYTAAGNFSARFYNNANGLHTANFDNFGVTKKDGVILNSVPVPYTGPNWVSQTITLGSFTVGNSLINFDVWSNTGDYVYIETTVTGVPGGPITAQATSGSFIPGLSSGTVLTSATLIVTIQMLAETTANIPVIEGLSILISQQFSSSGTRISPVLSIGNVVHVKSSSISWDAILPPGPGGYGTLCGVTVDVSPDGTTWTNVPASGDAIPYYTMEPDPWIDAFSSNTSADYTQTELTGGGAASWTWDTANSQLEATQTTGIDGVLEYTPLTGTDMNVIGDFSESDSGGLVARMVDASHCYYLSVADASAVINPDTASLYALGPSSVNPFSVYGTSTASSTLPNAAALATTSGSVTDTGNNTKVGTSLGYGEVTSLGTASAWAAAGSMGSPSGLGFLLDSTLLANQKLVGGTWTPTFTFRLTTGTLVADMYIQASAYDTVAHTYTTIGTMLLAAQTLTTTKTTFTWSGTSLPSFTFNANQRLYIGVWFDVTSNSTGSSSASIVMRMSTTTSGFATDSQLVTPGYQNPSGVVTLLGSASISFPRTTYHRFTLSTIGTTISASMDGTQLISVTDNTVTGSGSAGILAGINNGNQLICSRFRFQPLGQNLTGLNIYSRVTLTSTDPANTPQLIDLFVAAFRNTIVAGNLIGQTNYQYQDNVGQVLDNLCQQSNTWWSIDTAKKFHFQTTSIIPSPWVAADVNGTFVNAIKITNTSPLYRNEEWIQGGVTEQSFTQSFQGDGITKSWTTLYPIQSITSISVNGISQSIAIQGQTSASFYYKYNGTTISQDTSLEPLNNTQFLTITGTGAVPAVASYADTVEQTAFAVLEGGSGIVEDMQTLSTLNVPNLTQLQAQTLAQNLVNYYEVRGKQIDFVTMQSGLATGQALPIYISKLGIKNTVFFITQLEITVQTLANGTLQYFYKVTAQTGPIINDWTGIFANLAQRVYSTAF